MSVYPVIEREIQVTDVDQFVALRLAMLRESPDAFLSTAEMYEMRTIAQHEQRIAADVASDDVLFIGGWNDEELVSSMGLVRSDRIKRRHIATVVAVFVLPTARGRGVGGHLLDTLIEHATLNMRAIEQLQLSVASNNTAAIALYHSRGFERYGVERQATKWRGRYVDLDLMAKFL